MPLPSSPEIDLNRPLPISILTGFLGSGKTTVLRHLLRQPEMARTAVVINEFGEVGLDQHLIGRTIDDQTVLLDSGCLCCTIKDDLIRTLRQLHVRRAAGEVPPFDRMVVETTGLADPASIIHSLLTDQLLADCYRLDGVLATVDAAMGAATLEAHEEAVKQVAMADRLLLTKTDLTSDLSDGSLRHRMKALNPAATILEAIDGVVAPSDLFNAGYYDPETKSTDVRRWLAIESYSDHTDGSRDHDHLAHHAAHQADIRSFCLTFDAPFESDAFVKTIRSIISRHGKDLLRIKGILSLSGQSQPVVLHAVQHLLHPPVLLDAWPDQDHSSRIVFITKGVERETIEEAFRSHPLVAIPVIKTS